MRYPEVRRDGKRCVHGIKQCDGVHERISLCIAIGALGCGELLLVLLVAAVMILFFWLQGNRMLGRLKYFFILSKKHCPQNSASTLEDAEKSMHMVGCHTVEQSSKPELVLRGNLEFRVGNPTPLLHFGLTHRRWSVTVVQLSIQTARVAY